VEATFRLIFYLLYTSH